MSALPPEHPLRRILHDEVHARPVARIRIPALITHIAVLNEGIAIDTEHAHLRQLFDQCGAPFVMTEPGFIRARLESYSIKWERHGEFSRYSITQPIDQAMVWGSDTPELMPFVQVPASWLAAIPGQTIVAMQIVLLCSAGESDQRAAEMAQAFLGATRVAGSAVKDGAARLYTNFSIRADGFSRFVYLCDDISEGRSGRITAALAEMETYRTMALLGFRQARELSARLAGLEAQLADLTHAIDAASGDDATLLGDLMQLAATVETATARHSARFSASIAYYGIVQQRIDDLRGVSLPGVTGVFTFLQRRLIPAIATIEAAGTRLGALSERIARTSALLRTRVDIKAEAQNQELLSSFARGQQLQLRLQETVEGLSVAAIAYYVIGLISHAAGALHGFGIHADPELVTGVAVPFAVVGVWWGLSRVRARIIAHADQPRDDA